MAAKIWILNLPAPTTCNRLRYRRCLLSAYATPNKRTKNRLLLLPPTEDQFNRGTPPPVTFVYREKKNLYTNLAAVNGGNICFPFEKPLRFFATREIAISWENEQRGDLAVGGLNPQKNPIAYGVLRIRSIRVNEKSGTFTQTDQVFRFTAKLKTPGGPS